MALKRLFAKMGDTSNTIVPFSQAWAADLVTSELTDGRHAPAIDLDVPAWLVPSRTEGHSHLYIDVPCTWRQYRKLLKALRDCGIIEPGYYAASVKARRTCLRRPTSWDARRKGRQRAITEALERAQFEVHRMARESFPASADPDSVRYRDVPDSGGY